MQIVSPTATMATLTCSLNVTIPSSAIVTWTHNNTYFIPFDQSSTAGSTTTLTIENFQSSDAGVYQCTFNDAVGSGWILRRNIRLLITSKLYMLVYSYMYKLCYGAVYLNVTCHTQHYVLCIILANIATSLHE